MIKNIRVVTLLFASLWTAALVNAVSATPTVRSAKPASDHSVKAGGSKSGITSGESAFDKFVSAARKASEAGIFDEARADWKAAIKEAEKSGGKDGRVPFALVHLADLSFSDKTSDKSSDNPREAAISLLKRAVELREQAGAVDTPGMARNLERLGLAYMVDKDFVNAEPVFTRALQIEEKCGVGDEFIALTLMSIGPVCHQNKHMNEAEQYCHRLQDLAAKMPDSPNAQSYKEAGDQQLMLIYDETGRKKLFLEKYNQMIEHYPESPSPEKVKAIQKVYADAEAAIDASEESSFKK